MIPSVDAAPARRAYCRVDSYIPLEYRLIGDEEREMVTSRIAADILCPNFGHMPPLHNHALNEPLNHLNKKLDAIIQMLTLQLNGFHTLPFKFVTISGNGMKFSSLSPFSPNNMLEFKMILSGQPPVAIYIYGEVVRVERLTSGFLIIVGFTRMDDNIRNMIVHYVFEVERDLLRKRRCDE